MKLNRETIANTYIKGRGIEIGALHMPLSVPRSAQVRYVDRMSVDRLRNHYPELNDKKFVNVDMIADGERLETIPNSTQDFVIANHFLEHCQNPIGALLAMFRVLKPGGVLYLAIPDKRCSFDADRPVTTLDHIIRDYDEGPDWSRRQHYEEWTRLVDKVADEAEARRQTDAALARSYSIHFHVWTQAEMLELIVALRKMAPFELELCLRHDAEVIFVLRRGEGGTLAEAPQVADDVAAFARDLDRILIPEPWCIDNVSYDGEVFEITGWALAPQGRHELLTFTLNDREFDTIDFPRPRTDLAEVFWYKAGAGEGAFCCRTRATREEVFERGYATLKCVNQENGSPLREEYNSYYPDDTHAPVLPDVERRMRVYGENESLFRIEGFSDFRKLDLALCKTTNQGLSEFREVLDWGCGCGRSTRYFYLLPETNVTGVDVDADNLNWCRHNLSFGRFFNIPLHPPTSLEADSFDLVIGISVFSHLKEREQFEWLGELSRLAKPGAILLMSTLGEASLARVRWDIAQWDQWRESGFFAGSNSADLTQFIEEKDYYVNAYITPDYIRKNWSGFFEIIDIIPAYIGNHQDLVVMRKPNAATDK